MAIVYNKMGINIWEVIAAASTKPFGYVPFYPGPGVGDTAYRSTRSTLRTKPGNTTITRAL